MNATGDNQISFDEWVKRVFDHDRIDHDWWWKEETDWNDLPPSVSLDYLSRLFEGRSQLLRSYSDAQIDQGLWFLIGCGSKHACSLEDLSGLGGVFIRSEQGKTS